MLPKEVALFLDYENIHIGMEASFGAVPDVHILSQAISRHFSQYGTIIIGKAYGDWERFIGVPIALQREQIEPVYIGAKRQYGHQSVRSGVAKNAADIQLALDAQELIYTRPSINHFIIVSGDYDFVPLVIRLHQNSKHVCLSGIQGRTSRDLKDLVGTDFISIDELLGLKAVHVPRMPTVDWYAFVNFLAQWEEGTMPFIARKLFTARLPDAIIGSYTTPGGRENVVGEAIVSGILELYYVPNPQKTGTQTSAIKLNRDNDFVKSVLETRKPGGKS